MLNSIAGKLAGKIPKNWADTETKRGQMVDLYRQYEAGEHRDGLTARQKDQLNITRRAVLDQFNINYMPMVVGKMADRLKVEEIEVELASANPSPQVERGVNAYQDYIDACRNVSRFDELQNAVHQSAVSDGYTFVMLAYDSDLNITRWEHEPAYSDDTKTGVIPVLNEMGKMSCAIKIWDEMYTDGSEGKRINIYYPATIERYVTNKEGTLKPYYEEGEDESGLLEWTGKKGAPLGIPIHLFSNNPKKDFPFGQSELHNAIPLQDAANWTLVDLVMTSRLTAFPLRTAKGFEPDDDIGPGDWVIFGDEADPDELSHMEAGVIPQGEMVPFLETITHIEDRLSVITRTPIPSSMGSSAQSGEALKERQTMLVEKVERAQVAFGNAWEDVVKQSILLRNHFGAALSGEVIGFNTRWKPAQIRNAQEIISAAQIMHDWGYEREALRLMGQLPYLGYDDKKIDMLLEEKMSFASQQLAQLNIPGFGSNASGQPALVA